MKDDKKTIPKIDFQGGETNHIGFAIVNNHEILLNNNYPQGVDPFRPHRLRFYAILFIEQGEGHHSIDFKKYPYKKGSIIFIAKDQVHTFEQNLSREASFLLFTEDFLEQSAQGSNFMQELSLYRYRLNHPVLQLKKKDRQLFSDLVQRMKEEYEEPEDSFTVEIIQASLKIFLCMAERIRQEKRKAAKSSRYKDEFLQFQKLVKQHVFETRQVQYYADALAMSTKKLNRITHDVLQQSVKQYINDFLILEVKRLLVNTSMSIKEITFQSGFESPTNFVKYFKKNTSYTPSEFRKRF